MKNAILLAISLLAVIVLLFFGVLITRMKVSSSQNLPSRSTFDNDMLSSYVSYLSKNNAFYLSLPSLTPINGEYIVRSGHASIFPLQTYDDMTFFETSNWKAFISSTIQGRKIFIDPIISDYYVSNFAVEPQYIVSQDQADVLILTPQSIPAQVPSSKVVIADCRWNLPFLSDFVPSARANMYLYSAAGFGLSAVGYAYGFSDGSLPITFPLTASSTDKYLYSKLLRGISRNIDWWNRSYRPTYEVRKEKVNISELYGALAKLEDGSTVNLLS